MRKLIVALAAIGTLAGGAASAHESRHHAKKTVTTTQDVQPGTDVRTGYDADAPSQSALKEDKDEAREDVKADASQTKQDLKADAANVKDDAGALAGTAVQGAAQATQSVGQKVSTAGAELAGRQPALEKGRVSKGDVHNTLTTNPLGLFSGEGINLMYSRPLSERISGVAGANYSRTNAGDGSTTAYGVTVGGDYFLIGRRNEGLRVGPRVQLAGGSNSVGSNSLVGEVSAAGELGYNWIANNGLTAGAGAGLAGRLGGAIDTQNDAKAVNEGRGRVNPYGRLNIGYSW